MLLQRQVACGHCPKLDTGYRQTVSLDLYLPHAETPSANALAC